MPSPAVVVIMRRHNAPTFRFIAPRILLVATPLSPLVSLPLRPPTAQQPKQRRRRRNGATAAIPERRVCIACCGCSGRTGGVRSRA